jgi:hypothetical protein
MNRRKKLLSKTEIVTKLKWDHIKRNAYGIQAVAVTFQTDVRNKSAGV